MLESASHTCFAKRPWLVDDGAVVHVFDCICCAGGVESKEDGLVGAFDDVEPLGEVAAFGAEVAEEFDVGLPGTSLNWRYTLFSRPMLRRSMAPSRLSSSVGAVAPGSRRERLGCPGTGTFEGRQRRPGASSRGYDVTWPTELNMSPRLQRMLEAEELLAKGRGDGYLGTEHILEAIISDLDGVAGQILSRVGAVDDVRDLLRGFFESPDEPWTQH